MQSETVTIETVSPAQAQKYLNQASPQQRNVSEKQVAHYARLMTEERFVLSNDALVFDTKNQLINCQHRLRAIIASGKSQQFIVARGFRPESFVVMDRPFARRTVQFIQRIYASTASNCAHFGVLWEREAFPYTRDLKVEPQDCLEWLRKEDSALRSVDCIHETKAARLGMAGFLAFLHWYYTNLEGCDPVTVDEFFYRLGDGVGMRVDDPELALRNRLIGRDGSSVRARQAFAIKAIKARLTGKPMRLCRWLAVEAFPELELSPSEKRAAEVKA